MPDTCFICLQSCSRNVCFQCSCKAHPTCWNEFQKKFTSFSCPICRSDNIVKPYQTRSHTSFIDEPKLASYLQRLAENSSAEEARNYLISEVLRLLNHHHSLQLEDRLQNAEEIMYCVLAGARYHERTNFLLSQKFLDIFRNRLIYFHRVENWTSASRWHNIFFNASI